MRIPMFLDLQHWRSNHWLNLWLTKIGLSIWIKWTPQHDAKSNNASQDDEQHNAILRWRNHNKKNTKEKIYVEITYLDWKKMKKKMQMSDSRSKNDLKPPLLDEWKWKKTYREVGVSLTKKLGLAGVLFML